MSTWLPRWYCYNGIPGPISISDKTSYRKIPWSLKDARLVVWIIVSGLNLLGASTAQRSDNFIYKFCGFETSRNLTIRRLIGYWNRVWLIIKSRNSLHTWWEMFDDLWRVRLFHGTSNWSMTSIYGPKIHASTAVNMLFHCPFHCLIV